MSKIKAAAALTNERYSIAEKAAQVSAAAKSAAANLNEQYAIAETAKAAAAAAALATGADVAFERAKREAASFKAGVGEEMQKQTVAEPSGGATPNLGASDGGEADAEADAADAAPADGDELAAAGQEADRV